MNARHEGRRNPPRAEPAASPPFTSCHDAWLWCCRAPEKLAAETHAAVMALIDRGELWPRHRKALALVHLYGRAPSKTDVNERGLIPTYAEALAKAEPIFRKKGVLK